MERFTQPVSALPQADLTLQGAARYPGRRIFRTARATRGFCIGFSLTSNHRRKGDGRTLRRPLCRRLKNASSSLLRARELSWRLPRESFAWRGRCRTGAGAVTWRSLLSSAEQFVPVLRAVSPPAIGSLLQMWGEVEPPEPPCADLRQRPFSSAAQTASAVAPRQCGSAVSLVIHAHARAGLMNGPAAICELDVEKIVVFSIARPREAQLRGATMGSGEHGPRQSY